VEKKIQVGDLWKPIVSFVEDLQATEKEYRKYCLYRKLIPGEATLIQEKLFKNRVMEFKAAIEKLIRHYPLLEIFLDRYSLDIQKMNFKHLSIYMQAVDQPSLPCSL
jgi:hypothetical protein